MTPQQPAAMTTDQHRDWCAADDGWEVLEFTREPAHKFWWHAATATRREIEDHPYPPTRDGAAKAMPEGWFPWERRKGPDGLFWEAVHPQWRGGLNPHLCVRTPDTGNEIGDRFRLAVLCRIAAREAKA